MSCHTKYNLPGIPQHIVIRSIGVRPCFFSDDDYQFYLEHLKKTAAAFKCQIHAYVLMPDHVHILLTPEKEFGVSNMVRSLTRRYARYIEATYEETRPLWTAGYKSSLIDSKNYLFACMCYIEVNPVRSKIVDVPSEYKWSSYQANAYNQGGEFLNHHPMYAKLGGDDVARSEAYLRLFCSRVEVGSVHSIRNALHQELVLGSREFNESVDQMMKKKRQATRAEKLIMKAKAA